MTEIINVFQVGIPGPPGLPGFPNANVITASESPLTLGANTANLVDSTSGTIALTLPVGVDGIYVVLVDHFGTWGTHSVTLLPTGITTRVANPASPGTYASSVTLSVAGTRLWLFYNSVTDLWILLSGS